MAQKLRHGTPTAYTYGCRCEACRAAHAYRHRDYNDRKRAERKMQERNALIAEIISDYQTSLQKNNIERVDN